MIFTSQLDCEIPIMQGNFCFISIFYLIYSDYSPTDDSTVRRTSPGDKKKHAEYSEKSTSRTSQHVNVMLDNDEYLDDFEDTVQLVQRDDNEHAIS